MVTGFALARARMVTGFVNSAQTGEIQTAVWKEVRASGMRNPRAGTTLDVPLEWS